MDCKKCGQVNKQGAKFCSKCGAGLSSSFCSECGHKNSAGAQFCQECGSNLTGGTSNTLNAQATATTSAKGVVQKAGLSTGIKLLLGFVSVAVLGGGALFTVNNILGIPILSLLSGRQPKVAEEQQVSKIIYTTNPATVIEEGSPAVLAFDWIASTKQQVQDFIDNTQQEVLLNGTPAIAKVTYSTITPDEPSGGFKTQVTADVGHLPVGTNEVKTTLSWKKQITNGKENYGPGTKHEKHEKHEKHAKIIVNPSGDHAASATTTNTCPPESAITASLSWEGETPKVSIQNTLGWEPYQEAPGNPPMFTTQGLPWAHPVCQSDIGTMMSCYGEFDQPTPTRDEIGLFLPYPWQDSPNGYCNFTVMFDETNTDTVIECPTEDDIEPGEVYWESGIALIDIKNPNGWEPYKEMPDNPPFLTVNEEMYTDMDCEVDRDDKTLMTCGGPGTIKTGGMGLFLSFPVGDSFCALGYEEIDIKNICPSHQTFCVFTGACCSQTCDVNGCHGETHDDDHD